MAWNFTIKSICGYSLQGVVRAIAIYQIVGQPVSILFTWIHQLNDNKLQDVPVLGKRGLLLLVYLILPLIRMIFSIVLFKACKSRNLPMLWAWIIMHVITFGIRISLMPFYWHHLRILAGLPVELQANSDVVLGMKIIGLIFGTIWAIFLAYLVYCFIREVVSCGELNATLIKLSDKDVQELQMGLLNLHNANIKDLTIPISNLLIDEDRPLGSGRFGIVYKAVFKKGPEITTVAVKSVQRGKDTNYIKTLLEEFVMLAYLGNHKNVVKMIGTCPELLIQRKLYLVMEYCAFGSLSDFLRIKRSLFVNFVEDGNWTGSSGYVYANLRSFSTINTLNLLQWTYDTCKGMEFLEEKKVLHRDLAARNVLLDHRKVAKISDFGFSMKLSEYKNIVRDNSKPVPWRWMAIESLADMEFSSKSDAWSFGCTIWEIFCLGEIPFTGHVWDSNFINKLKSGELRLQRPSNATHELYAIMSLCWSQLPKSRPSFSRMSLQLGEMILKYTSSASPKLNENIPGHSNAV